MFEPRELKLHLAPSTFFPCEIDLHPLKDEGLQSLADKYLLPDLSDLLEEIPWAKVKMGWHQKGIAVEVISSLPAAKNSSSSELQDRIELFFDTRNRKDLGFASRFCHHFVFWPIPIEGKNGAEITRLRIGEEHPLADPELLLCETDLAWRKYTMKIFIPSEALTGYDTHSFDHLGFTYRMVSAQDNWQHFNVLTKEFALEQRPALWSSLKFIS